MIFVWHADLSKKYDKNNFALNVSTISLKPNKYVISQLMIVPGLGSLLLVGATPSSF